MNLLNDCSDAQDVEKDVSRQRVSDGKLTTLRNATIQAMSNLLSANIDSGLMHSIGECVSVFIFASSLLKDTHLVGILLEGYLGLFVIRLMGYHENCSGQKSKSMDAFCSVHLRSIIINDLFGFTMSK